MQAHPFQEQLKNAPAAERSIWSETVGYGWFVVSEKNGGEARFRRSVLITCAESHYFAHCVELGLTAYSKDIEAAVMLLREQVFNFYHSIGYVLAARNDSALCLKYPIEWERVYHFCKSHINLQLLLSGMKGTHDVKVNRMYEFNRKEIEVRDLKSVIFEWQPTFGYMLHRNSEKTSVYDLGVAESFRTWLQQKIPGSPKIEIRVEESYFQNYYVENIYVDDQYTMPLGARFTEHHGPWRTFHAQYLKVVSMLLVEFGVARLATGFESISTEQKTLKYSLDW